MANGLFATPSQVRQAQMQQGRQEDFARASLPSGRGPVAFASQLGRAIGGGVPRLFGAKTPQEKLAESRQKALQKAHQAAGDDPEAFLTAASQALMQTGDFQGALSMVDKLQQVRAQNAQIGQTEATAGLRRNQAEDVARSDEQQRELLETKIDAQDRQLQQKLDAEESLLDKRLGFKSKVAKAEREQAASQFRFEHLQEIRDWRVKAQRADSYDKFVEAKKNYWNKSLEYKGKQLALKKKRNKSLNASNEYRALKAQAVKDYKSSVAQQAAQEVFQVRPEGFKGVTPENIDRVPTQKVINSLPADIKERVSNDINDFIGGLEPMKRFLKQSLSGEGSSSVLPSTEDQERFGASEEEVDLDFSGR